MDPVFSGFLLAVGGHSATKAARRQYLALSSQEFLLNRWGSFPILLGKFLSAASYFGIPVVLLTMSFWDEPNYLSWLRQPGTYVLKVCIFLT